MHQRTVGIFGEEAANNRELVIKWNIAEYCQGAQQMDGERLNVLGRLHTE